MCAYFHTYVQDKAALLGKPPTFGGKINEQDGDVDEFIKNGVQILLDRLQAMGEST